MGRGGRILRALFGAAIFWGLIWFMYVGILPSHATTLMARIRVPSAGTFKHLKLSGGESHLVRHDMDLNYVSKRRVPNGPDPIHNRLWNSGSLMLLKFVAREIRGMLELYCIAFSLSINENYLITTSLQ
ncbi:CLAVATA3/ESR (CLE)-RELATED PROTEIN 25 [Salix koriyanagi]|uniref:CLAVATA3/ESR (CLE)-RELATED PROTEIN 25 n=1 Tax=Salix koriyanagi TaxID=2511006 RepID=A0A9Q0SVK4_9ROSI|nr:CLAVATA3/ESR (CLE)-RELATED PROTEIN 25 [Salix koriyanagi]